MLVPRHGCGQRTRYAREAQGAIVIDDDAGAHSLHHGSHRIPDLPIACGRQPCALHPPDGQPEHPLQTLAGASARGFPPAYRTMRQAHTGRPRVASARATVGPTARGSCLLIGSPPLVIPALSQQLFRPARHTNRAGLLYPGQATPPLLDYHHGLGSTAPGFFITL